MAAGALALVVLLPALAGATTSMQQFYSYTDWLIPSFEDFSPTPYWDVSRYSWGYGTPAPGPTGTISKDQALIDMRKHVASDYAYLSPMISRDLTANQWAALLDFSYNLGTGNADNLVPNINAGDDAALETQWKKYVHAGGVVSQALVDRRAAEWDLWTGQA